MVTVKKSIVYATKSAPLISGTFEFRAISDNNKNPKAATEIFVDKYSELTFLNIS